ncbi:MAG: PHP-associated domain-containing protein [Candidatus Nanoarchaeia archaeon]|nr:PHP-associated domain-containing protein [Candidatus Nanoarchaeia archaeon]MDD5588043.1 PHP-associated domain-containing protein [Candidatus Nanoarchaeia archaeon]
MFINKILGKLFSHASQIDADELKKEGLFFDMHFHTNYSDGATSIKTLNKLCKKYNVGVAITDHNEIKGCMEAALYDFNFIPGIELRPKENFDMLIYFYKLEDLIDFFKTSVLPYRKKLIYSGIELNGREIFNRLKKYNCITSIPHPYGIMHGLPRKIEQKLYIEKGADKFHLIKQFDCIEVMNGHLMMNKNEAALELAKKYGKAYTGGSDGHVKYDLGKVLTYSRVKDTKSFLDNLKKRKVSIYCYEGRVGRMLISRTWAFRKHVKHPIHYVARIMRYGKTKIKDGFKK